MVSARTILVAGIGNIFLGDDAFGCEVAQQLAQRQWPNGVRVHDFGIRGIDLAYELGNGYDVVIFIDAAPHGALPGDLAIIEPETQDSQRADSSWDSHTMTPDNVLRLARQLGVHMGRVLIVGCEPTPVELDLEIAPGLSESVRGAINRATVLVESLVRRLRDNPYCDLQVALGSVP
jgi:hydrogenase maturation protease